MLNVTQEQKTAFLESTPQEIQITATPETGTAITITNANIVQGSFSIDRSSVSGNDVEIGNVSSAELIMVLNNSDGTFDNFTLEGATLEVEIRPQGVGSFISMGKFVVDEITRNKTTINVVALDYMVALDVEMDRNIFVDEETAPSAIAKILTVIGISDTPVLDLVNDTVVFTPSLMKEGATYRDFLICILEIAGANAYFIGDTFYATWYSSTVAETFNPSNRVSSDMQGYGVEITGVVVQDGETVYEVGTKDYPITITSNNLITSGNVTAILTGLQSRLVGFTYQPFTATTLPMPWLMPMDKINYVKDETTHPTIITNAQFILNQNTPFEAKGQSPLAKGYAKKAMTKAQENNMKALEQSVESSINEIKNYFWHDAQGVHVTEYPNDATIGNNVLIDHDSLDIRDGETVVASFGENVQIGADHRPFYSYMVLTSEGMELREWTGLSTNLYTPLFSVFSLGKGSAVSESTHHRMEDWEYTLSYYPVAGSEIVMEYGLVGWTGKAHFTQGVPSRSADVEYDGDKTFTYTYNPSASVHYNYGTFKYRTNSKRASAIRVGKQRDDAPMGGNSVGFGNYLNVSGDNQLAIGAYNANNINNAFEIGNGTNNARSNAFAITWDGDAVAGNDVIAYNDISAYGTLNSLVADGVAGASLSASVSGDTTTGTLAIGGTQETSSKTASADGDINVIGVKTLHAYDGNTSYMVDVISEMHEQSGEAGFEHQRLRFDVTNGITNGYKPYGSGGWTTVFQLTPEGSLAYLCKDIPEADNLNDYTRQGTFACRLNATAETLSNCPTTLGFRMEVTSVSKHLTNTYYVVQKITDYQANEYVRWAWRSGSTWNWNTWRVLVNRLAPTLNWNNTYVTNDRGGTVLVRDNVLYLNVWFKTSQQIPQDTVILSLGGLTRNFTRGYFPITGTAQVFGQVYTNNNGNSFTSNTALAQNTAYRFINAVLPLME